MFLIAGGALGLAYDQSPQIAMTVIVIANVLGLVGLVRTLRKIDREKTAISSGAERG